MVRSWKGRLLLVTTALLVGMLLGAVVPASAGYDKAYRFKMPATWSDGSSAEPEDVTGVRIVTNAMEILTDQYDGWRAPWEDTEPLYVVSAGTYVTRLNYNNLKEEFDEDPNIPGETWDWDKTMKIGFTVTDSECRLRDLRWVLTDGYDDINVTLDESAVPGGGELIPDGAGGWIWRIWNDQATGNIELENLELATLDEPLPLDEDGLGAILEPDAGIFDMLSADINEGICYLYAEVCASNLNHGQKHSLRLKLTKAAVAKWLGDEAYLRGHEARALELWGVAAREMGKFASQVRNNGKSKGKGKGKKYDKPPQEWADIADGLAEAILALPGTTEFGYSSGGGGGGTITQAASEDGDDEGDGIPPGGYIDIALGQLPVGSAAVLHGEVTGSGGEVILEWADQVTIPGDTTPPALIIVPEPIQGTLVNPEVVTLTSEDADAVFGHWGLLPDDLYEPFTLVSGALPMDLTFEGEGYYEIVCFVEDSSGNLSAEEMVTIIIDDGGSMWDIAQEIGAGWAWLGTRPEEPESETLVNVGQGQSFTLGAPGVVMSVEVPIRLTGNPNSGIPSLATGDLIHAAIYGPTAGIPLQIATTAVPFDVGETWLTFEFDVRVPLYAGQYILGIYTEEYGQCGIGFCPGSTDPDPYPYGMRYVSMEGIESPMVWQSWYGDTDMLFRVDLEYFGMDVVD